MKKNRYSAFKERALTRPKVREVFEEGLDVVRFAVSVADLREKRGLTHLGQVSDKSQAGQNQSEETDPRSPFRSIT